MEVKQMDRYFYSLEKDNKGNRTIHLSGNVYFNDNDETETCYRIAEWVGLEIEVIKAKQTFENDEFFNFTDERVKYLDDITEEQAKATCEQYFNGTSGTELHIMDITEDTPCGDYWFERR